MQAWLWVSVVAFGLILVAGLWLGAIAPLLEGESRGRLVTKDEWLRRDQEPPRGK